MVFFKISVMKSTDPHGFGHTVSEIYLDSEQTQLVMLAVAGFELTQHERAKLRDSYCHLLQSLEHSVTEPKLLPERKP